MKLAAGHYYEILKKLKSFKHKCFGIETPIRIIKNKWGHAFNFVYIFKTKIRPFFAAFSGLNWLFGDYRKYIWGPIDCLNGDCTEFKFLKSLKRNKKLPVQFPAVRAD